MEENKEEVVLDTNASSSNSCCDTTADSDLSTDLKEIRCVSCFKCDYN